MNDFTELKQTVRNKAIGQLQELCEELLPQGKRLGREWVCGDLSGAAGKSLNVTMIGDKAGLWYDFATGEGGDIFSLYGAIKKIGFIQAFDELCARFNVNRVRQIAKKTKPRPPSKAGIKPLSTSPALNYMHERGLQDDILKAYNVRYHGRDDVRVDKDGQSQPFLFANNEHYWIEEYIDSEGDRVMLKSNGIVKNEGKHDIWTTPPYYTLWGWWLVKPTHTECAIVEGNIDAMSVYQLLGQKIPVFSVPNGAQNMNWIDNDFDALHQFDKIYIIFDMDKPDKRGLCAGEEGAKKVAERLGRARCFRVRLPEGFKDPNEVLCGGDERDQDVQIWLENAQTYDPPTMRNVTDFREDVKAARRTRLAAIEHDTFAFNIPFVQMPGEVTLLQGYPGSGKSDVTYQIALHNIEMQQRVLVCSFEIPEDQMIEILATQWCKKVPTDAQLDQFIDMAAKYLWFVSEGEFKTTPDNVCQDIEYACRRFNVEKVYIDSLHFIVDKDDYQGQDEFIRRLKRLFRKLHIAHCTLIAHSRFGDQSDHRIPRIDDIEGSKGMIKPVQNVLTMWRNKPKEDALEDPESVVNAKGEHDAKKVDRLRAQPDAYIVCQKQRNGHRRCFKRGLWFDFRSRRFRLEESRIEQPVEAPEEIVYDMVMTEYPGPATGISDVDLSKEPDPF